MAVSAAAHQLPVLSPLTASALAASQRPEQLLPEASAALALFLFRREALAISEGSAVLAGSVTFPLLVRLQLRKVALVLAQHLFLPLGSVLPASLRLRS